MINLKATTPGPDTTKSEEEDGSQSKCVDVLRGITRISIHKVAFRVQVCRDGGSMHRMARILRRMELANHAALSRGR
jgi:hypothetical protein